MTLYELRTIIRRAMLDEVSPPYIRDVLSPETDDREPIEQQSLKTLDGEYELAAHLQSQPDQGDTQGPVGRRSIKDDIEFAPQSDPYSSDWQVVGRGRFGNAR